MRGASSQAIGAGWEEVLDQMHLLYQRRKWAMVVRAPPAFTIVRMTGKGAQFYGFLKDKGPPDYFGTTADLALLLEAKTNGVKRFDFNLVEPHQADRMTEWESYSDRNFSGVLYWCRPLNRKWLLPWSDICERWHAWKNNPGKAAPGTASLNEAQLDKFGVRFGQRGWIDALDAYTCT